MARAARSRSTGRFVVRRRTRRTVGGGTASRVSGRRKGRGRSRGTVASRLRSGS